MWSSWLGSRLNLVTHTSACSFSYSLAPAVFEATQLSWAELGEVKLLADLTAVQILRKDKASGEKQALIRSLTREVQMNFRPFQERAAACLFVQET